ncbi:HAD family hydrolase [Paenibacillus sp. N1-5-1-14]|uniref:HAD family hydrolase n=1 Tax=Paenibacillus radicibacter TaxID=2972488 RepID=UPI002158E348|nr:HAD family hydrolase [Paenibacillus radicibacter]MCR8641259.1 HAD family hydrolase [Paenibacillus radicibacter]
MSRASAVIFDLDNTLLDRTLTFQRFCEKWVDTYFPNIEAEQSQSYIDYMIQADLDGYRPKPELFEELIEVFQWQSIKPTEDQLMEFYQIHYVQSAVLMDGALELLTMCKQMGMKVGLVTNGRNVIQYGKIDQLQMRDYFDHIIVSEEAGCKKPNPLIYKMILERLQVHAEHTIFVGDHPANDVEGAANVGMQTIWLKRNQKWDDRLHAIPIRTITLLGQLLNDTVWMRVGGS